VQRRAGEDLLRSLALIVEPEALRASIAGRMRELTGCDSVIVCSLRPEADLYPAVCTTSVDQSLPDVSFAANGTLGRWLKANQEPFLVPHPQGALEYLDPEERQALSTLGVKGCVPIFSGIRLVAILLICAERADWQLTEEDVDLLVRLSRQSGLALENAELHQLERERLKNLHRAEQLAVAGQLAATVAHEIRNPLTAIRSTVQYVLQSTADWETRRRLLEESLEEVDRIERTVSGVLALSRTSDVELGDLDLIANIEQSLLVIQAYAQAQGVAIDRQFEVESLPIRGDSRGLHQVCINLFMNACQAMPDGGRLTLRCSVWQPSSEARAVAMLQVRDTGRGISREHLPHVFSPFFTTKQAGTGLGLPICLDIVTRHGGNLRIESTEGRGTSATVLLPLRPI
jgi:signal transduction histidine kinase